MRKTSSFLKLHGDLLLPEVSFCCSAPIIVGLFPSWNQIFSVPPFPLVPSVRPVFFLQQGMHAITAFGIDWAPETF